MRLLVQALAALETALTPWLQGANADALLYDKVYGGVVSTNGVADPYGDYGSGTTPPCAAGHCVHQDDAFPDASSFSLFYMRRLVRGPPFPLRVLHVRGGHFGAPGRAVLGRQQGLLPLPSLTTLACCCRRTMPLTRLIVRTLS